MVSASTIIPTGTRISNRIGVRVLLSKKIGAKLYPYRKMINALLNISLVALAILFGYFCFMSFKSFYSL
ncbi:MAG: hypothetical protein BACD_02632 [Bacteroides rodentium]